MKFTLKNIISAISTILFRKNKLNLLNETNEEKTLESNIDLDDNSAIQKENNNPHPPLTNPLQPFLRHYLGQVVSSIEEMENKNDESVAIKYTEKYYAKEGRNFTFEQYNTIVKELLSLKNFLHEEKTPILKKLWEDAQTINNLLVPLKKIGIPYTLDITGGAARDFILNKHNEIKDIDFMVSFSFSKEDNLSLIESIFSKKELDAVSWYSEYNLSGKKQALLELCINRLNDTQNTYFYDRGNTESRCEKFEMKPENGYPRSVTTKNRLLGVMKTKGTKTHYPIDLLLTDYIKPAFLEEFDFDICKASFSLVNDFYNTKFPKNYSHLISRFIAPVSFFADVVNKKFTYNPYKKSPHQLDSSLNGHLKRLLHKFPEYHTLIINDGTDCYTNAKKILNKTLLEIKLDKKLPKKSDIKTKKI